MSKAFLAYWDVRLESGITQRLFVAHRLQITILLLLYTIKKITKGVHK